MGNFINKNNRLQTSETFFLSGILAISGGFQDAYTYDVRDNVFSNAQTGNVVLMSQDLMRGDISSVPRYLIPVLAFALGIIITEQMEHYLKNMKALHWRQLILLIEIIILFVVGFIPSSANIFATVLVSFSCAMQVQAFRKVNGFAYASTMCIGNLRSGTESLSAYFRDRDKARLYKAFHYYGIILLFAIGAGLGGVFSFSLDVPAIWISCGLLIFAFILMKKERI